MNRKINNSLTIIIIVTTSNNKMVVVKLKRLCSSRIRLSNTIQMKRNDSHHRDKYLNTNKHFMYIVLDKLCNM